MKMDTLCCALLGAIALVHFGGTQPNVPNLTDILSLGVDVSYNSFHNWANSINGTKPYLIVYPRTSIQVASIVTWAYTVGRNVRVQGYGHSYPPIIVSERDDSSQIIIVNMTRHMKRLRMRSMQGNGTKLTTIIAEPGASMDAFMTFAERKGYGIVMTPIIGADATVGGVLAIGGHGAGVMAFDEKLSSSGFTFGSVSNSIAELEAVVWDSQKKQYVLKTFLRSDPDIAAFIVHIGRAIITEVTLLVGRNYNMRCLSRVDIPSSELFAHPDNSTGLRTMSSFIDSTGRVDAIFFPFTEMPWLKIWEVTDVKPNTSLLRTDPYNYQFSYTFNNPQSPGTVFGPQTYQRLIRAQERYPIDQYIKLRVTELDDPRETHISRAVAPDISPTSPMPTRPDFDVGVWMNTLTTTNRPYSNEFMRKFEQWAYQRYNGTDALVRPEWSKNWGYTKDHSFADQTFLHETIPHVFGIDKWNHAINVLDKYDPHHVISNRFLKELMVPYSNS